MLKNMFPCSGISMVNEVDCEVKLVAEGGEHVDDDASLFQLSNQDVVHLKLVQAAKLGGHLAAMPDDLAAMPDAVGKTVSKASLENVGSAAQNILPAAVSRMLSVAEAYIWSFNISSGTVSRKEKQIANLELRGRVEFFKLGSA